MDKRKLKPKPNLPVSRSFESLYSSSSSKDAVKAQCQNKGKAGRTAQPHMHMKKASDTQSNEKTTANEISEIQKRIMSARLLRVKSFQNQLTEAQRTIAFLTAENRMLRTLHQRQDVALVKYESANADLPKLLNSHAEEVRVWEVKCCNLQTSIKDLEERLQKKEALIFALSDQNKYFSQLNKNKQLEERERLSQQLQALEAQLLQRQNHMKRAIWRLQAQLKHLKQLLTAEQKKVRSSAYNLEKSRMQLEGYEKLKNIELLNTNQQETNNMDFVKENPELTAPSADGSELSHRIGNQSNNKLVKRRKSKSMGLQHARCIELSDSDAKQHVSKDKFANESRQVESILLEDFSSVQSCDEGEAPSALTEDEDVDVLKCKHVEAVDFNYSDSQCSFNTNNITDGSITEDDVQSLTQVKPVTHFKREISDLRGKFNKDYIAREEFLDNFSRQASLPSSSMQEADEARASNKEQPIVNEITEQTMEAPLVTNAPAMRVNKLLASLKTLDAFDMTQQPDNK